MKLIKRDPGFGYIDTDLWLPKGSCNSEGVKNALTFPIVEHGGTGYVLLYRETANHIIVPREFWDTAAPDLTTPIVDCRPTSYPVATIRSRIKLDHRFQKGVLLPTGRTTQKEAVTAAMEARGGIIHLSCGIGKSVIALELAARKKVPTLIVVDTTQLVRQWREEVALFLDVPDGVGLIGDGEFDWKKPVVLATYHTLAARADTFPEEIRRWFGLIVFDEVHHASAPTFSKAAMLFYGQRYGLTATTVRADGLHVVYQYNLGPVIYKNLEQDLKPKIYFKWTGVKLDPQDVKVQAAVRDKSGELHLGKLATYFGQLTPRLDLILAEVKKAVDQKRKVLVLSKSVDETINLLARWNGRKDLYTDLPYPSEQDVGEKVPPCLLHNKEYPSLVKKVAILKVQLEDTRLNPVKRELLEVKHRNYSHRLAQHAVAKKIEAFMNKRQALYLKELLREDSTAGLMIGDVNVEVRSRLLKEKSVTFAIMKYGREGLNERSLDTLIVCEPVGEQGSLQQLMGRVQREMDGKQEPVVIFLEDDIGPLMGMCHKLRRFLREWSPEDGGPYSYEIVGHPSIPNRKKTWNR